MLQSWNIRDKIQNNNKNVAKITFNGILQSFLGRIGNFRSHFLDNGHSVFHRTPQKIEEWTEMVVHIPEALRPGLHLVAVSVQRGALFFCHINGKYLFVFQIIVYTLPSVENSRQTRTIKGNFKNMTDLMQRADTSSKSFK
jgi:uncharacterized phage infection (PIP) family protein YhgE